jgi:hypothetical protein
VSFSVVPCVAWKAAAPLAIGQASISGDGRLSFRVEDLRRAGIEGLATLLADTATLRLAVRKPRQDEAGQAYSVQTVKRNKGSAGLRRCVQASRALKLMALTPAVCRGRYPLSTKDDLLIVSLAGISQAGAERGASAEKRVMTGDKGKPSK